MGFGALMIRVRGVEIKSNLGADGGTLEVRYQIVIEEEEAGSVSYRIEVRPAEPEEKTEEDPR